MKYINQIAIAALLLLGVVGLYAQETPIASGGEATGSGGTASYLFGTFYGR